MATRKCTIVNQKGLHVRAAAEVVKLAETFHSEITVSLGDQKASADNLIHLLTLAAYQGKTVKIKAKGTDEQQALNALEALIDNHFNESE